MEFMALPYNIIYLRINMILAGANINFKIGFCYLKNAYAKAFGRKIFGKSRTGCG